MVVKSTGKEHKSQQTAEMIVMDTFGTLTYLSLLKRHIILWRFCGRFSSPSYKFVKTTIIRLTYWNKLKKTLFAFLSKVQSIIAAQTLNRLRNTSCTTNDARWQQLATLTWFLSSWRKSFFARYKHKINTWLNHYRHFTLHIIVQYFV